LKDTGDGFSIHAPRQPKSSLRLQVYRGRGRAGGYAQKLVTG
jgi:hypothetical protein